MTTGTRTRARHLALQALYEVDLSGHEPLTALDAIAAGEPVPAESLRYARELVQGVTAAREEIDAIIVRTATAWPLGQISTVDRNVLRLAIWEIVFNNQVPVRAAINEAVELAKLFGSDHSARFVNGVLASVSAMKIREQRVPK